MHAVALLLVAVGFGAIVGPAAAHQHLACAGDPMEGRPIFLPSPQSCSSYILCLDGEAHIDECENNLHFDAHSESCGNPAFVDCTQCGRIGFVKLPHPSECDKYYECTFGRRQLRTCPTGLLFDRTVGSCNREDNVWCPANDDDDDETPDLRPTGAPEPERPVIPLPTCLLGQVHHAHALDCTRYYLCVRGELWEHRCPSRLHWNERAMACDLPASARCRPVGGGGGGGGGNPLQPATVDVDDLEDFTGQLVRRAEDDLIPRDAPKLVVPSAGKRIF